MIQTTGKPHAIVQSAPMQPYMAEIVEVVHEAPNVSTYWLQFLDKHLREGFTSRQVSSICCSCQPGEAASRSARI
jgi:hypothetical protein